MYLIHGALPIAQVLDKAAVIIVYTNVGSDGPRIMERKTRPRLGHAARHSSSHDHIVVISSVYLALNRRRSKKVSQKAWVVCRNSLRSGCARRV